MNIGIAGAGAIGCHYGSLLQQAKQIVTYLARGKHLQAMQADGLLHVSAGKQTRIQVHADDNPQLLANADVVLLTGKMTDFNALLAALKPYLRPDALLVTLQNGVVAPDAVQQLFPGHALAAGTAFIGARIEKPGMVVHSAAGGIRMGWWQHGPGDGFFVPLMQALKNAGVQVRKESDAQLMLWRKLLWNIGFNALTAITRRFARDMAAAAETLPLVRQAMQEAIAVAQANGINLTEADIAKHIEVTLAMGPVKTSMWQDIDRHRPTEVDFINGFIAKRGVELGIGTPVNRMLTSLIHAIEHAE
ncbi:MAG: 2-dehydropantoate 2-reductase [Mariprofundaceae bacterium]|nr:2-dehydropantoate 2-reductase [Mariprofundaceae bacterium]